MIGQRIGNYEVISLIGQGGMGAVYLAEHPEIGRKVAIKVILPEHLDRADAMARFLNEARATGRLKHPALVDTIDFGKLPGGGAYITMEYLEGESLGGRLKQVLRMRPYEAARILRQIADGVGYAHAAGIVHRDLKPDNIFLTPHQGSGDDQVKILDFGIAKILDYSVARLGSGEEAQSQTRTGMMVGTPLYMSPEQCRGRGHIDHRADVYSLGCIAYRMLCGVPPFDYGGMGELIAAHLTETPVPPRTFDSEIPEALDAVVLRALEKRPEDRFQSMAEMVAALDDAAATMTNDAFAAAGGRTAVLPAVSDRRHPSSPLSPLGSSAHRISPQAPAGSARAGKAFDPTMSASPHASLEGRTQVLQPGRAAAIPDPSQRARNKTTLSGSTGEIQAPAPDLRGGKGTRLGIMVGAAVIILGGAGYQLFSGGSPARPTAAVPVQVAVPVAPSRPIATPPPAEPRPEPAPPPPTAKSPPAVASTTPASERKTGEPERKTGEPAKASSSSPRTRTIRVAVSNAPAELTVLVDGRPGRLPLKLPQDGKPHTLRFESKTTRPETRTITADQDQTLDLANKPKLLLE